MRWSHRRLPTGTNGTSVNCLRLRSRRNCAKIGTATKRLPSNKEGKSYNAFAERRLQASSPEISPSVVPKLYRNYGILHRESACSLLEVLVSSKLGFVPSAKEIVQSSGAFPLLPRPWTCQCGMTCMDWEFCICPSSRV